VFLFFGFNEAHIVILVCVTYMVMTRAGFLHEIYLLEQDDVKKGCQIFQKCQEIVDKLALFSSNEDKDDISTGDLKYLLVRNRFY